MGNPVKIAEKLIARCFKTKKMVIFSFDEPVSFSNCNDQTVVSRSLKISSYFYCHKIKSKWLTIF